MLNKITIMGRLTRDPESKTFGNGGSVANFSVAVDRDYSGKDGGEKKTDFFDCVAWRKTAEFICKYMKKGSLVVVSGSMQFDNWVDKEGNSRKSAKLNVENIYFGESKRSNDSNATYGSEENASSWTPHIVPSDSDFVLLEDDDNALPF